MTPTPAGWYDDGRGALRWWDGTRWTEHVRAPAPASTVTPAPASTVTPAPAPAATAVPPVPPTAGSASAHPTAPAVTAVPPVPPTAGSASAHPTAPVTATAIQPPAPATATRGWVLPVILGAAFAVVVALAVIFIPMIVSTFAGATYSDDEAAAIDAVTRYDEAWNTGNCELLQAATTETLREVVAVEDCASFEAASDDFQDSTDDYAIAVTTVATDDEVVTVQTDETYTSYLDDDGNTVPGFDALSTVDYTVIEIDGEWVIDDVAYLE